MKCSRKANYTILNIVIFFPPITNNFFSTVVLSSFRNKIRKILNFTEYISNNSNCCKLCSEQTIIYFYFIFFLTLSITVS